MVLVRCILYNESAQVIASESVNMTLLYPKPNHVEIDPEQIYQNVVDVTKKALRDARLTSAQVTCLGISCQRGSFVTWSKATGKPFHNVITWRDLRAKNIVKKINQSLLLKLFNFSAKIIYILTRSVRFLTASQFKVLNIQVPPKLRWVIENIPELREALSHGDAAFGTLDTWILYKLSGKTVHVTEASCAASTGLYDPFIMDWSGMLKFFFKIPGDILPNVLDSSTHFCDTQADIFGNSIPVTSSVADQSASMFGSCSFSEGDIKFTMGTGSFLDINTGRRLCSTVTGLYPLVAWRINGETTYMTEGSSNDTGVIMKWVEQMGLVKNIAETSDVAQTVPDSDGVCFIPSFSGLQAPINDSLAAAGMIGLKSTTTRAHVVRGILLSIAFRIDQLFEIVKNEMKFNFTQIKIDGGVSQNDFIAQVVADLTGCSIIRSPTSEVSAMGAAFLAGLANGVWTQSQLPDLLSNGTVFYPCNKRDYKMEISQWRKALTRFGQWYEDDV